MAGAAAPDNAERFPSVDEVLNKLKSNGTFDQFRKTCLASVQAEVRLYVFARCNCSVSFLITYVHTAIFQGLSRTY